MRELLDAVVAEVKFGQLGQAEEGRWEVGQPVARKVQAAEVGGEAC